MSQKRPDRFYHRKRKFAHHTSRGSIAPSISKTELRALADHAAATHKITKLPPAKIISEPHE